MALISLVYTSFATRTMTDEDTQRILAVSRKNNQAVNVTGMLLFKDGYFIQALEGEAAVVEPLYDKIAKDPRHAGVRKLFSHPISKRSFADWTMGFNKLSDVNPNDVPGFTDFLKRPFDPAYIVSKPSRAVYLLEFFKTRSLY